MTLTYFFDQYFQWWQSAAGRYVEILQRQPTFLGGIKLSLERYLEFRQTVDRVMDEVWRNLRVPTLEDITRLHERLNLIEARLIEFQEQNQVQEVAALLDDLKSLTKTLKEIKGKKAGVSGGSEKRA